LATMSVKMLGDGGAGYGKLAETLVKGLFRDPKTEMDLALKRQDYESEAWRRRVMEAQEANAMAAAAHAQAQANTEAWQLGLRQESLPDIQDYQAGLVERPAAIEPPAPVELPAVELPAADTLPELAAVEEQAAGRVLPLQPFADPASDPATAHLLPEAPVPVGELGPLTGQAGYLTAPQIDPLKDPAITTLVTDPGRLDRLGLSGPQTVPVTPEQQATYQQQVAKQEADYQREVAARRAYVQQVIAGGGNAAQVAQGLGISEGNVKLESQDPEIRRQGEILYTGKAAEPGSDLEAVQKLRKEFSQSPEFTDWMTVKSGYDNMRSVMDNIANMKEGDEAMGPAQQRLIYSWFKMLDPNTGVKEGEVSTAQEAGGKVAPYLNLWNRMVRGEIIDQNTMNSFLQEGFSLYKVATDKAQPMIKQLTDEATRLNIDPERVIREMPIAEEYKPRLPENVTEEMISRILAANPGYSRTDAIRRAVDMQQKGP
jgi:hypothetical protein